MGIRHQIGPPSTVASTPTPPPTPLVSSTLASSTLDSTAPALPTLSSVMLRLIPGTPAVHGEVAPAGAPAATVAADTLDGATVDTGSVRLRLSPRSSSSTLASSTPD